MVANKISEFFRSYPVRVFGKQQILIRAEEPLQAVFYIVEGWVSEYDITPSGNEVVVNVFKPGAFFPMSAALNSTTNYYFFEASTVVKAHVAPPDEVVQFVRDNPEIAFDLLKRVYRGTDGVLRRMTHLMGGDAMHRLLFEIINAAYRFGEVRSDGFMYLPLHESDIARRSGLARETVNRHLQTLKKSNLLAVAHGLVIIKDLKGLELLLDTTV